MNKKQILISLAIMSLCGCSNYLDPLQNGSYNEDNYKDYPTICRGFVEKAYSLRPQSYISTRYIGTDCLADDGTWRERSGSGIMLATGQAKMTNYFLSDIYATDYSAIYYCNRFLEDDIGLNTRYLVDSSANAKLQRALQGDAYGLRAWYLFDLLKLFGGKSSSGELLGVPIITTPTDPNVEDVSKLKRATYEECVQQILSDCDSAYKYLPLANRNFLKDPETIIVLGAARYRRLDGISVKMLKALVQLTWASPAFNPDNDKSRWDAAARTAKEVIDHKLNLESYTVVKDGFDPAKPFMWNNPNTTGAIYISNITNDSSMETNFYPIGFNGSANYSPTQELVEAFPMANGYPITDSRSGYDSENPFENRDSRFYSTIFYNGSRVVRNNNASDIMYTFNTVEGDGQDEPNLVNTSRTGYYIKKYIYLGWNKNDASVQTAQHCIFFYRWAHACLTFAEAANHVVGPLDEGTYGLSAKNAIAYLRNRPMEDGSQGVGANGDPYLEECASQGEDKFDELVKNEWRLETCYEGFRFFNLRRWATDVSEINTTLHGLRITRDNDKLKYETVALERRSYPSLWMPIPYKEIRKAPNMEQNEGWESWK